MAAETNSIPSVKSISNRWRLLQLLLLMLAGCCLLVPSNASKYSPLNRHWGWDLLLYIPRPLGILFTLVLVASLFPKIQNLLSTQKLTTSVFDSKNKTKIYILCSAGIALLFWLLRVKYYFLGDFNIRMLQCIKGDYVSTEYLGMWFLHQVHTVGLKLSLQSDTIFKLYSVVAGFFFVLLAFFTAEELSSRNKKSSPLFFAGIVCTAQLLLFCGYVEIYATPAVLLLWFVYSAIKYINNSGSKIKLLAVYALALASHLIVIAALPALLYSLLHKQIAQAQKKFKLGLAKSILLVLVAAVIGCLLLFAKGHQFLMVTSAPPAVPHRMTLFSFTHIWEFLNGQVLCSGLAVVVLPYLLFRAIRKKQSLSIASSFFLLYALGILLLTFVSDLQRGSGDWDIMSFTALPLNMAMICLCFDLFEGRKEIIRQITFPLLTINLISAVAWALINHSDASIKKITDMLEHDPASYYDARISGATQLALCFQNNYLDAAAEPMAAKACAGSAKEDVTPCLIYARCLVNSGRVAEAANYIEDLINNRSAYSYEAYIFLLPYLEKTGQHEKTLFFVEKMYAGYLEKPQQFLLSANFDPKALSGLFGELYAIKKNTWSEQQKAQALQQIDYITKWQNNKAK